MTTKTIDLWLNHVLEIPNLWGSNGVSVTKSVKWDETKTTLIKAELLVTVSPNVGYVKSWINLNGVSVQSFYWSIGDSGAKTDRTDIIGSLLNGSNIFNFIGAKEFANPAFVSFIITARLILEFEGEAPNGGTDYTLMLEVAVAVAAFFLGLSVIGGMKK